MDIPLELSLEQQFSLKLYEQQLEQMSHEQSQAFVLELMRQLMIKNNVIQHLMHENLAHFTL